MPAATATGGVPWRKNLGSAPPKHEKRQVCAGNVTTPSILSAYPWIAVAIQGYMPYLTGVASSPGPRFDFHTESPVQIVGEVDIDFRIGPWPC